MRSFLKMLQNPSDVNTQMVCVKDQQIWRGMYVFIQEKLIKEDDCVAFQLSPTARHHLFPDFKYRVLLVGRAKCLWPLGKLTEPGAQLRSIQIIPNLKS